MNSKQRVITALTRAGLPDRVPLQFDLSRSLADRFAEKHGIPTRYTTSYYEDVTYRLSNNDLRVAMGSDCVIVGAAAAGLCAPCGRERLAYQRVRHEDARGTGLHGRGRPPAGERPDRRGDRRLPLPRPAGRRPLRRRGVLHRKIQTRLLHRRRHGADDVRYDAAACRPGEAAGGHGRGRRVD